MHAELSYEEDFAHKYIADKLRALGLNPTMGLGRAPPEFEGAGSGYERRPTGTGVMADIKGLAGPGPCIALRADIDALPILETAGSAADLGGYRSINEGCMHACGHDAHTAMLLSTAAVLVKHADRLRGSIRLIFQPAEEFGAGAKMMVQDGCMEVRFREPLATTHTPALRTVCSCKMSLTSLSRAAPVRHRALTKCTGST